MAQFKHVDEKSAFGPLGYISHGDAHLIFLCEAHPELLRAVNSCDEESHDNGPCWQAYFDSVNAITNARPETLSGLLAKALVVKSEASLPDGSEDREGTLGGELAWNLVDDLCRILLRKTSSI